MTRWRYLDPYAAKELPEARLGGGLMAMVLIATVVVVLVLGGVLNDFAALQRLGLKYMIAVSFAGVWSAAFIIMTLLRLPATPWVASMGFIAWIAYRGAVAAWTDAGWPLSVDIWTEILLAAGFMGYMAEGLRPNAYYRRRIPMLP